MSMELHVFLAKSRVPDFRQWQAAIDALGYDVKLDGSLAVDRVEGFVPVKLKGRTSGFELYLESGADLLKSYSNARAAVANRDVALSFRWGGDLNEMVCVLVAAAALTQLADGVWYDPQEDETRDAAGAIREAKMGFGMAD